MKIDFLEEATAFFAVSLEVKKNERFKFIAINTDDGRVKGKILFCCRMLNVMREGFRQFLIDRKRP